jgi:hypothetical protein
MVTVAGRLRCYVDARTGRQAERLLQQHMLRLLPVTHARAGQQQLDAFRTDRLDALVLSRGPSGLQTKWIGQCTRPRSADEDRVHKEHVARLAEQLLAELSDEDLLEILTSFYGKPVRLLPPQPLG